MSRTFDEELLVTRFLVNPVYLFISTGTYTYFRQMLVYQSG